MNNFKIKTKVPKVWIISDTHLGVRSNSNEWITNIENYFTEFFIPLVKEKSTTDDILIHCGDVFDSRQSINLLVMNLGIKVFGELSKYFKEIHVICGNHDIYKKKSNDVNSLKMLTWNQKIHVHESNSILNIINSEGLPIKLGLMPWHDSFEEQHESIDTFTRNKTDYLFCHTDIQDANFNRHVKVEHGNTVETYKSIIKVFSGHIHYRQELSNVIFVGSPYEMTRSDIGNAKGIYVLDTNTGNLEFIQNTYSPKFKKINLETLCEWDLDHLKEQIHNSYLDVLIPEYLANTFNLDSLIGLIEDTVYKRISYKIVGDNEINELEMSDEEQSDFNLKDLIIEYISDVLKVDDTKKESLTRHALECYNIAISKSAPNED